MTPEEHVTELERTSRTSPALLDPEEVAGLVGEGTWVYRMLVCRLIARVEWPTSQLPSMREFLLTQCKDPNKFVKAWAMDALASLAVHDLTLRPVVDGLIADALASGPPSLAARARHAAKRFDGGG